MLSLIQKVIGPCKTAMKDAGISNSEIDEVILVGGSTRIPAIQKIVERIPGVRVVNERPEAETSWFGVPIICDEVTLKAKLVAHLEKNKIQTRNYFAGNILLHPG